MAFVTTRFIVCDRCGRSETASDTDSLHDVGSTHEGWARCSGERVLCPDCAPGYELLRARHKVEEEDYLSGR